MSIVILIYAGFVAVVLIALLIICLALSSKMEAMYLDLLELDDRVKTYVKKMKPVKKRE